MADEIRVTDVTDRYGTTRAGAAATMPSDPGAAREEIQATRARISETIDEIEGALLQKKERLEDRLDVLAPVRENPMRTLSIVFGVGLALGLLTGGGEEDDEDDERDEEDGVAPVLGARAELWETRARRLLRIARDQEEEIHSLRHPRGRALRERWEDAREEAEDRWEDFTDGAHDRWEDVKDEVSDLADEGLSVVDRVREYVSENIAGVIADTVGDRLRHLLGR